MFPAVAFRPVRLLAISACLTAVAMLIAGVAGQLMVGAFMGIGLLLGLLNALLVRRSVEVITSRANPLKRSMALNSASRVAVITILALVIAYLFRPSGLGVVFGLALFQVLLVVSTAVPVWKKLRTGDPSAATASRPQGCDGGVPTGAGGTEGRSTSDD
ncbi:hypothetical protein MSHI_05280 [Mycobacterium shinjukuense]|uniref:ATP synthase subunit I n=1 Tax=Mycobacterium shinjukuense TaxID=398694 RepID=A0A7I7MLB2_9MYCO|nr:hypothetical protein MSHI_05280 [Mycobacterium shinjukuense]